MDSLIHYHAPDMARVVAGLAANATGSVLFTFAPRTPLRMTYRILGATTTENGDELLLEPLGVGP